MRRSIKHELKILPKYYDAVISGIKTFELRRDDRDFQVGDWIVLREWSDGEYTGRETAYGITYVLRNVPDYGLQEGYCIINW